MWKEIVKQLTLGMAMTDPLVWSYFLSDRLDEQAHPEVQRSAVARSAGSGTALEKVAPAWQPLARALRGGS
jgi:hypothetical protein